MSTLPDTPPILLSAPPAGPVPALGWYGVVGSPLAHTRSPALHNAWLAAHNLDARYLAFLVAPADFASFLRAAPALGIRGLNITIPHKVEAARLADAPAPRVQRLGAANTLILSPSGRVEAHNTDSPGATLALADLGLSPTQAPTSANAGDLGEAIILGAGGTAAAILDALAPLGFSRIVVCARSTSAAEACAARVPNIPTNSAIECRPWPTHEAGLDAISLAPSLLVNATPLGLAGGEPFPFSLAAWHSARPHPPRILDAVYRLDGSPTPLVAEARALGWRAADGSGMLLHQARLSFEHWFGVLPSA